MIGVSTYPDALSVDHEYRPAHGIVLAVGVALEELLREPEVEALVVGLLQFVAIGTKGIHFFKMCSCSVANVLV